jgi:hypothetical protein
MRKEYDFHDNQRILELSDSNGEYENCRCSKVRAASCIIHFISCAVHAIVQIVTAELLRTR